MRKRIPSYLKLAPDLSRQPGHADDDRGMLEVCRVFEMATGWPLEYANGPVPWQLPNLIWSAPVCPGVGNSPGHFRILSVDWLQQPRASVEAAGALGGALARLFNELAATRGALRQREAELAVGVPTIGRSGESSNLAERLEAVLRGGVEAVGCQAAAMYLLDQSTTELKLRSSWGLARRRLIEPPRPLNDSLADLEALLGHAVVLTDQTLFDHWRVPEAQFAAAVCVPVSTAAIPLGTLWIYSTSARDFSDSETNMIEVVAGRLASDLEREVLVEDALLGRRDRRQLAIAEDRFASRCPPKPLIDDWEVAARATQAGAVGGAFYDWWSTSGDGLSLVAAVAGEPGLAGAMTAATLRGAIRAAVSTQRDLELLPPVNSAIWCGSAGEERAAMIHARLGPAGALRISAAGSLGAIAIGPAAVRPLVAATEPLGARESPPATVLDRILHPHEALIVFGGSRGPDEGAGEVGGLPTPSLESNVVNAVRSKLALTAEGLVNVCDEALKSGIKDDRDRVVLVVKRRK